MRILLTGASGLVGGAFARAAAGRGWHVTGVVGSWTGGPLAGVDELKRVDLADAEVVTRLVREAAPAVIVNAAAIAEPAQCEAKPELARRLNVELPDRLAQLAAESGARLIHLSTEQVFDGTRAPYRCADARHGINLYAQLKIEAEDRVRAAAGGRGVILRLPLLLGNSPGGRRSVHERLLQLWAGGGTARLFSDEIRQPCTAESVGRVLVELARRADVGGALHWAGCEPVSRYEIGRRIRERFGLDEARAPIVAVARRDDPAALASRQENLSLDLAPLAGLVRERPQTLADALAELRLPEWAVGRNMDG